MEYADDKFKDKYRIDTARAWWHDYDGGAYFITICTKDREHYFGEIENGAMVLSAMGEYTTEQFRNVSDHYPYATIPLFTIMPNHVHIIIFICDNNVPPCRDGVHTVSMDTIPDGKGDGVHTVSTTETGNNRWKWDSVDETMQFISKQKGRLSVVIGGLKRAVTHHANQTHQDFAWQTRFYDRIVRDQPEMNRIATYIENNVANWHDDEFYTPRR